jgi:hypothetical protein
MGTEKIKFKIELYATMWDKPPHAEIIVDGKSFYNDTITGTEDKPTLIEFEHKLEEDKNYELIIKRTGKSKGQTVVNEKGDILKDQLLNIKGINIDDIDIGALIYEGEFTPIYPEPWATQQREAGVVLDKTFKQCSKMGHDGEWKLKFASPFYMWLLENLY